MKAFDYLVLAPAALAVLAGVPSTALAGGTESHGGGGFVCKDAAGKISVELLDLWEAQHLPLRDDAQDPGRKLTIPHSDDATEEQIGRAFAKLARIDSVLHGQVTAAYKHYMGGHLQPIADPDVELARPSDVNQDHGKRGCELKGVASYDDDADILSIDPVLEQAMSRTDRAALYVHEAVYKAFRTQGRVSNSILARQLTAYLFAREEFPNPKADVPRGAYYCEGGQTASGMPANAFYYYPAGNGTRFQFVALAGLRTWIKTSGDGDARALVKPVLIRSAYGPTLEATIYVRRQTGPGESWGDDRYLEIRTEAGGLGLQAPLSHTEVSCFRKW
jgi:hypothetical protein